ncbi:Histone-lysine N-methyltransferase, H3 lysine-9 specific SUVH6 [Apostasia shenzhenica]|uniref:Histone-lysine N-methyltransferase, H3 lysine-9 specific SUVH6 n=1 Tax=Apostasia shenzhenica TaxID=1088818 RepID=A0A2I0AP06_9ASPA|nr:Histone-lysine N-methyltransferase, H3 lysine-9 specific SUVH6 [Apostasia shenzhenica]
MMEVSIGTPPKYKRRKVFAIRQFPRGCGPNVVQSKTKSSAEASVMDGLENGEVSSSDRVLVASDVGEERVAPPVLQRGVEEVAASNGVLLRGTADSTNGLISVGMGNDVGSSSEMANEFSDSAKLQNGHVHSKIYGPPKRRKVSAIRQFPPGCGPSAYTSRTDGHQRVVSASTLLKDDLLGGKVDGARKQLYDDSVRFAGTEIDGQMGRNVGNEILQENDRISGEVGISSLIASPKSNSLKGEDKKPTSKQQEIVGGSLVDGKIYEDEKSAVKQIISTEGSVQFKSAGKVGFEKMSDSTITKQHDMSVDVKLKPASRSGLNVISKGKSVDKDLVRSNSDKNLDGKKVQNTGAQVQGTASKSGLSGNIVGSKPDVALSGRKISELDKNLQVKANDSRPSHLAVKSPRGTKVVDKELSSLSKRNSTYDNDNIIVKRKLSEGLSYKNQIPEKVDIELEAYAERMVILAMNAADNCPWSNPKKRRATNSNSVIKNDMNREKRLRGKDSASMVLSSSQYGFKEVVENDGEIPQQDENSKALVVYQVSNERTSVMNPIVSPELSQKGKALTVRQKPNEMSVIMTPFTPTECNQKNGEINQEVMARNKVKRALRLFQLICRKLLQGEESRSKRMGKINRIDLQTASILKEKGEWLGPADAIVGHIPGVQIGDEFHYRVELSMVGLHRPYQAGIDSTKKNGIVVAASIVASAGYQDDIDSDVLIYSGSGGNSARDKQAEDQKLERGNLGLRNCIDSQTPVRVIYGFKEKGSDPNDSKSKLVTTFTYDGLYQVISYWQEIGPHGFNVFKFQLKRIAGQPELALKELKRSAQLKTRVGLCVKDIATGKEKFPIIGINIVDTDLPMPFNYITKNIYPSWYELIPPKGCDCTDGCSDSENCACAVKNGGEIPFNYNGAIVQAKPLIYECGPSCKCPSSCHNRVSQHGIRIPLEIFKTEGRGWGVRSLKSIPSGSFICEYIGELLQDGEAEQRTNDEYLFDIGHNYDDQSLWHDLPNLIPNLQSSSACDTVENVGFTIDAAEYGNIGRFINHSCSPNLYAQNVLYDHDDKRIPHIMFFAVDNIPPLQELTYHYNYTIDQVRDCKGNIKQKTCRCGSPECSGRLY